MTISKRLRFEILRRDNHACRYCGGRAPDVRLTVDHVVPVALGGLDEPENLVTACADCNGGKSATPADASVVADVAQDQLRWARAIEAAAETMTAEHAAKGQMVRQFMDLWEEQMPSFCDLPDGFDESVLRILAAGLPWPQVRDAVFVAAGANHVARRQRFKYFCGVCWSKVRDLQERAAAILAVEGEGL